MSVLAVAGATTPAPGQDQWTATGQRPTHADNAAGVLVLPGSTRAVLLLCAQAGLRVTLRPVRGGAGRGFVAWLLDEDPQAGFGFLVLDEQARVLALQLFEGPGDPRLLPDLAVRVQARTGTFRAVVTALATYRRGRQPRLDDAVTTVDHASAAAVVGEDPGTGPTIVRRCHRAA